MFHIRNIKLPIISSTKEKTTTKALYITYNTFLSINWLDYCRQKYKNGRRKLRTLNASTSESNQIKIHCCFFSSHFLTCFFCFSYKVPLNAKIDLERNINLSYQAVQNRENSTQVNKPNYLLSPNVNCGCEKTAVSTEQSYRHIKQHRQGKSHDWNTITSIHFVILQIHRAWATMSLVGTPWVS